MLSTLVGWVELMVRGGDVAGNPIADGDNYRVEVVMRLPKLEVLDKEPVTPEEREAAQELLVRTLCNTVADGIIPLVNLRGVGTETGCGANGNRKNASARRRKLRALLAKPLSATPKRTRNRHHRPSTRMGAG